MILISTATPLRTTRRAPRWVSSGLFWLRRYAPPELTGTFTMLIAGIAVAATAVPPIVVGIVSTQAENIGFYSVASVAVWREQRRTFPQLGRVRIFVKTLKLLLFEFGPAELLDTLLVRPLFLTLAVHFIPSVGWALLIGKIAADIVFYVLAATAFRVTEKTGARGGEIADAPADGTRHIA